MRFFYTLLLYLAIPVVLARLYWRSRRDPEYRRRWAERFGIFPAFPASGCIWIHAVSVGETRAAQPLIYALKAHYPDLPVLVTTTTPAGSRQVQRDWNSAVWHVYAPFDLPDAIARFLKRTRPQLAIIMETELWPNLYYACCSNKIPLILGNARLSERAAQKYQIISGLTARMLTHTTLVGAQTEADAARFRMLGAPRVTVTGNLKYELILPPGLFEQGRLLRQTLGEQRPVFIAASTHVGEDELLLDALTILHHHLPHILLLLVPRHPERCPEVAELCLRRGLQLVKRSEKRPCDPLTNVFLGDTMGELLLFYAAADVAFVGGSLVPVGGHNILEPAMLGLPVLFGRYIFHFSEAGERLLETGAAWQITDAEDIASTACGLLADKLLARTAGEKGRAMVWANRGALQALLAIVETQMSKLGH
jgi:3-deoxy-D-manno-octulosonic-acid transferase